MSSISERDVAQPKGITRRDVLKGIAGITTTLTLIGGCAEIYLPQGAEPREDGRPQAVSEIQIDEEAARNVSALYTAAVLAMLFFLRKVR